MFSTGRIYQVMPELWLRKVYEGLGVLYNLYVNSNIPEKRVRMMLSKKEIFRVTRRQHRYLPKKNMVSRYLIRLHDETFEHLCYALVIKRY